jgi:cytochrome c
LSQRGGIFQGMSAVIVTSTAAIIQVVCWAGVAASPEQKSSQRATGENLIKASHCSACHAVNRKVVGPAYRDVAKRYRGQAGAAEKLVAKIRLGGSGNWGTVPMAPHPDLTDAQLKEMVRWILSLGGHAAARPQASSKLYAYGLADGTTVKLDFRLFVEHQQPKVTKAVFRGYEMFNSYCYRCHGQDATGSETAPDLRHSLNVGMTGQQFLSAAMVGRLEKGMPSWAGFFNEKEIKQVYEYVKGRSLDLVPVGRPPSEMD